MQINQPIAIVNDQEYNDLPKDLYISPESLQVFLERFEGPLDLLLYLIRKQNLDILTIPIAKITDQYMLYINGMQVLNFDLAGEYLLMAAMLLAIKSRMLLPKPVLPESEDEGVDPRQELIQKLLEYEKIKFGAQKIDELPIAQRDFLWIDVKLNDSINLIPELVMEDLVKAWYSLVLRNHKVANHQIKREELSVREHMSNILRTLAKVKRAAFSTLFEQNSGVAYIVVNFIAILELTKEGLIGITSENNNIFININ